MVHSVGFLTGSLTSGRSKRPKGFFGSSSSEGRPGWSSRCDLRSCMFSRSLSMTESSSKPKSLATWKLQKNYQKKSSKKSSKKSFKCKSIFSDLAKGGFFSESALKFFQIFKSQKNKYSKKLSWAWNLYFPPITVKCYWREI